jgi:hypothetical protein
VFIEEYSGVDVCTVLDNLPVLTPFVSFRFQCPHNVPNIEFELFAFTSIASKRQPIHHIDGGKVLQVEAGTALAGKETTVPGVFLAPGLYQWSYYTADPLTGQLQFVGIDYNSVKYPLTRLTDPPAFTQDFGQLIVSNLQVFFQVENTGLTDITFNCALVGPL